MKKDINEILKKVNNLQHNFHTAIKVSKMLDDFNVSITNLSNVIAADQALTTTILKHCNSAQYGFSRKITTVKEAIAKIGFKTLKSIIFAIVSKSSFNREVKGYGLKKGELWKNSLSCGIYARYLADITGLVDPDEAFTAGLLRDVGKIILHEYVIDDYNKIVELIKKENISFLEAEEKIMGFNHCQIGMMVADKWNFPKILVDVIKYHHNPELAVKEDCENIDLVKIVHFADSLAVMLGHGIGKDGMMYEVDLSSLETLGIDITPENMDLLISDMANLESEINLIENI